MGQRDLKLNSLGRYTKNSTGLVLEVHGHCEVPAGCGGAVLRWRNPDTGLVFLIRVYANGPYEFWIDGAKPSSGRPVISYGNHAIAMAVSELTPGSVAIAVAVIHDEDSFHHPRTSQPSGRKVEILSTPDGTWRYTTTPPSDAAWMDPAFDDSSWTVMASFQAPAFGEKDMRRYRLRSVLETGATCLGITGPSPVAWIRKAFTIVKDPSLKTED
jgi:hypothetical protein